MMSRAQLYEQHAKSCIQAADRVDNLDDCEMLLRLTRQWMQDAKTGVELSKLATGGRVIEERKSVGPHERKVSAHSNRAPTFGLFDSHLPAHHRPVGRK